jgi:hypothetical protein
MKDEIKRNMILVVKQKDFRVLGYFPITLSVKHIKTDNIKKYVKDKYSNYKKNSKFNQVVIDVYLLPRSHSKYVS